MPSDLVIFDPLGYNKSLKAYLKKNVPKEGNVLYVTLNKTYLEIEEFLSQGKLKSDRFFFIDGVTTKLFQAKTCVNCAFFDSLDDLSAFTDALLNTIKINKIGFLVFDSISSMMIYRQDYEIISFLESIWPYLKKLGVDAKFIALSDDRNRPAIKQLAMMVDDTVLYDIAK